MDSLWLGFLDERVRVLFEWLLVDVRKPTVFYLVC